ncbi:MAG: trypsin-like peptidase domain-containing protein [Bacteroidota bacterium]
MSNSLKTTLIAFIAGGIGSATAFYWLQNKQKQLVAYTEPTSYEVSSTANTIPISALPNENFVTASEKSTSSVVFIQTLSEVEYRMGGWMDWFFEPRSQQRVGSGSGVVFAKDGYIVTNNHVISDADEITVIAGKRSFPAELIGRDPGSDLAVIKINSDELPVIEIGSSSNVKVGEWVLAVGNPFNLTSTVTAGIVSAKGRNINILKDKFPIESFIQTDAAINPGNSGGALVNGEGKLVGINTAILSKTGSYAGYGFAIPVNIVKKVFNDIVKYGEVQKAFTGLDFIDIDSEIAERIGLTDLDGILVTEIKEGSAADNAGIEARDVIRSVNQKRIASKSAFEELIAERQPGDVLDVTIERDGSLKTKTMILTNREGTTSLIKRDIYYSDELDASFETVSKVERDLLNIRSGVKVIDIKRNGYFSEFGIPEGFIITQINSKLIRDPKELSKILTSIRGQFDVIGINARGRKVYFPYRR